MLFSGWKGKVAIALFLHVSSYAACKLVYIFGSLGVVLAFYANIEFYIEFDKENNYIISFIEILQSLCDYRIQNESQVLCTLDVSYV